MKEIKRLYIIFYIFLPIYYFCHCLLLPELYIHLIFLFSLMNILYYFLLYSFPCEGRSLLLRMSVFHFFFFWQIFSLDREFLVDSLSSFSTLETLYHLLDLFSDENSALMYVTFPLHEICLCLVCFPIFLFIFLLSSWVMMFLGVVFLVFILLGFHQCPWVSALGFP